MIRTFQPHDMNDCVKLAKQHCEEVGQGFGRFDQEHLIAMIREICIDPTYQNFVIAQGDDVVGYAVCQVTKNLWNGSTEGVIHFLYVDPKHRNGYTSKDLFAHCEQWFDQMNCDYFAASVTAFDDQHQCNQDFLHKADQLYGRMMTPVGKIYVKGCQPWVQ